MTSDATSDVVVVHIPDGALAAFEGRIQSYVEDAARDTTLREPVKVRHAALVDAIADFRSAAFQELWTDPLAELPEPTEDRWFQVWLRPSGQDSAETRANFARHAGRLGISVESGYVTFPGRVVVAVQSTRMALQRAISLLDQVAEIRGVKSTADFYVSELDLTEQAAWIRDLAGRIEHDPDQANAFVTVLDTGAARGHPLLAPLLAREDIYAVDPDWSAADNHGHGTEMCGVAAYGNLTGRLDADTPVRVRHRLESVKILPDRGENPPHLYGAVTSTAARLVEESQPDRKRVFSLATTAGGTGGSPTEWSATIDKMAFGLSTDPDDQSGDQAVPRLFVVAAGNIPWTQWDQYPLWNDVAPIEDPAQAWNALTVGACTSLIDLDATKWPGLNPIAESGALAPVSTTSVSWSRKWPFKPDVVAEGGNGSLDAHSRITDGPEDLQILTTGRLVATTPLVATGGTSPASAEVARLCARIHDRYPDLRPETVRALVAHGAKYTASMSQQLQQDASRDGRDNFLRRYGAGRIHHGRSGTSTSQRATIILEETIAPCIRRDDGEIRLGPMNLHELPWPVDELEALGETRVEMKVTLSYFVEPNPARRGWRNRFRYQSHGLRFAVRGSSETQPNFERRINRIEREVLAQELGVEVRDLGAMNDPDVQNWTFGSTMRVKGSLHFDTWRGTAAALAQKSDIAVYPVGGWWKEAAAAERADKRVAYSLCVTLEILEDVDVDIYTPIATQIETHIEIPG